MNTNIDQICEAIIQFSPIAMVVDTTLTIKLGTCRRVVPLGVRELETGTVAASYAAIATVMSLHVLRRAADSPDGKVDSSAVLLTVGYPFWLVISP